MAKRKTASSEVLDHVAPMEPAAHQLVHQPPGSGLEISFSPTLAEIASMKEKYSQLTADTPEGYEEVKQAIRVLVPLRTSVDARRLELGAHFREQLKIVNSRGNRVIELLEEIEEPLRAKKLAVDEAKEREALARAQAIEAEQRAKEEQRLALLAAEENRKKEEAEAELRRRQAAIDKEREEFELKKKEFERQQHELREAQEKVRLEQERQLREAREKVDAEEKAKLAKIHAEEDARREEERKAQAELDRIANEQRIKEAKEKAAAAAVEAERQRVKREQEAADAKAAKEKAAAEKKLQRAPDLEKVKVWRDALNEVIKAAPTCKDAQAIQTVGYAKKAMIENAGILTTFINAK